MEMEYKDPSRKGRWIIVLGLVLAVAAAGGAFYVINSAQQTAGQGSLKTTTAVVAAKALPAKKTLTDEDLVVRSDIPLDGTNSLGGMLATKKEDLVGRILGVDVAPGQLMTFNLLASTTVGGQFPILGPGETVAPDSDAWRAVSITVSDDHAVGGMLTAGMTVDVLTSIVIPGMPSSGPTRTAAPSASPTPSDSASPSPSESALPSESPTAPPAEGTGKYTGGMSTKVTYQDMKILAKQGTFYVLKATLPVAEEITQAAADGATFTLLLRPDQDTRVLDVSLLGATTSRILQRYGLLIPETYPVVGAFPSNPPIPAITPMPSPSPSAGDSSAPPSGAPSAAPSASGG